MIAEAGQLALLAFPFLLFVPRENGFRFRVRIVDEPRWFFGRRARTEQCHREKARGTPHAITVSEKRSRHR
jgi:hypothetical protein